MLQALVLCCGFFGGDFVEVNTRFRQVYPPPVDEGPIQPLEKDFQRSPKCRRAVVLIHGLHTSLTNDAALEARLQPWQKSDSPLVRRLGAAADVYSFAYGQNVAVDRIAGLAALEDNVRELKRIGYTQIVLVGHSAGGLIARQFVEDHPDCGVTKVVQVCAPNGGTGYAKLAPLARREQKAFITSLTEAARQTAAEERKDKRFPRAVQFLCVVGTRDGLVTCRCQWTADLQEQGIPVLTLPLAHTSAMHTDDNARLLCEALVRDYPRWSEELVRAARGPVWEGRLFTPPGKE